MLELCNIRDQQNPLAKREEVLLCLGAVLERH
jgi:hypothetical protein